MGSGYSTKYKINSSCGTNNSSEMDQQYDTKIQRSFDDDYLNDYCNEKINQKPIEGSSVENNYQRVKDKYPLRSGGNLGDYTDHRNYNVSYSDNPIKDAMDLYDDLSYGGQTKYTENGHGIITKFKDGSNVLYRPYTSTEGSSAVDISVFRPNVLRMWQRVHFIRK